MEGLGPPEVYHRDGHVISRRRIAFLLFVFITHALARLPVPCTDLKPIYLLHVVAPDRYRLPPGVEIMYDESVNLHAFRFSARAAHLSFPASLVFRHCEYFPEEFSVLATFKVGRNTVKRDEAIFSLLPMATKKIKLGLRLYRGKLQFDYTDRTRQRRRVVEFRQMKLFDGDWHTVIISVTGDKIILRIDCGKRKSRRIRRVFPAFLSVSGASFHIANVNKRKTQFTGLLKQLMLLPGSDASLIACPSSDPSLPDISRAPPNSGFPVAPVPPYAMQSICTWRDTGKLWFDIYHKTLKVCYSGIWQTVLLPPDERVAKRIDYFEWHQDIVTAAPTIDIEVFRIPDVGLFMATASFSDSRELKKQQSAIFRWERGRFTVYQSLYTLGAQGWEHFIIGKQFFLAVANHGQRRDRPSKSVIYRWSRKRRRFKVHQELVTWNARDLEYFQIEGHHYLAVANHVKGQNHTIDSEIYRWNDEENKFTMVQSIQTVGAYDWTHFQLNNYHFLVVANSFSGPPRSTTRIDSVIYFWQKGVFVRFQALQTTGATDWEFFTIKDDFYLVVANAYNYGAHTDTGTERYQTNSTIFRLNKIRKQFEPYQEILTYSAVDWESFRVGDDTYLVVSNTQEYGGDASSRLAPTERYRSAIYRWQGVEKFVPKHYLETFPSADWETFTVGADIYLVYANAKDNISQVYKIKFV